MIIRRLNSLFHRHNRWLFALFALAIGVPFVWMFTPGSTGCDNQMFADEQIGTAYGRPVKPEDLRGQQNEASTMSVINRQYRNSSLKAQQLFVRFCMLEAAERAGISASDAEVTAAIRQLPAVRKDGVGEFDPELYKDLKSRLSANGIDNELFFRTIRNELILSKLRGEFFSGTVTPGELETFYRVNGGKYFIRLVQFEPEKFTAAAQVADSEVRAAFDAMRQNYEIIGNVSGLLVKFSGDNARETARGYSDRIYDAASSGDTADLAALVRGEAAKDGGEVSEFEKVSFKADSIGGVTSSVLVDRVAAATGGNPVAEPFETDGAVYVGVVLSSEDTRPAEFEEVEAQVRELCVRRAATALAMSAAATLAGEANLKTTAPEKLAVLAGAKDAKSQNIEFSPLGERPDEAVLSECIMAMGLKPGELNHRGSAVVMLVNRTPADMAQFEKLKPQVEMSWRMQKAMLAEQEFYDSVFANCQMVEGLAD